MTRPAFTLPSMEAEPMKAYGLTIPRSWDTDRPRDVIATPERTPAGNVAIATGIEIDGGWTKTGHVVLTASEARELAAALLICVDRDSDRVS